MIALKKIAASVGIVGALIASQAALADTISIDNQTVYDITPSSDTLVLYANTVNTSITATPKIIDLQIGNFIVDYSTVSNVSIPFSLNQNVTINGITKNISFNFGSFIGSDADSWSLASGTATQFGNVTFQTLAYSGSADTLGDHYFTIQAQVSAVPEPETYALMMAGLGLLAFAAKRRKSA